MSAPELLTPALVKLWRILKVQLPEPEYRWFAAKKHLNEWVGMLGELRM